VSKIFGGRARIRLLVDREEEEEEEEEGEEEESTRTVRPERALRGTVWTTSTTVWDSGGVSIADYGQLRHSRM
jgi:hypothetical protein